MRSNRRNDQTYIIGLLAGAGVGLLILLVALGLLAREPGNALKAAVAVWLALLPVLGIGALGGWVVASGLEATRRRRT